MRIRSGKFDHAKTGSNKGRGETKAQIYTKANVTKIKDINSELSRQVFIHRSLSLQLIYQYHCILRLTTFQHPSNNFRHIQEELDELDRESFARIKLIQKKKMHHFTKEDTDRYSTGYSCPKSRREDDDCTTSSLTGSGSSCVIPRCIRGEVHDDLKYPSDITLRNEILDLLHNEEDLDIIF